MSGAEGARVPAEHDVVPEIVVDAILAWMAKHLRLDRDPASKRAAHLRSGVAALTNPDVDGPAGSALLSELVLACRRFGASLKLPKTVLKLLAVAVAVTLGFAEEISEGSVWLSIAPTRVEPFARRDVSRALETLFPRDCASLILRFAGPVWWRRERWLRPLPPLRESLRAYCMTGEPWLQTVWCFECSLITFAPEDDTAPHREVAYGEWSHGHEHLWIRTTAIDQVVAMLRTERPATAPSSSVVRISGFGDVFL